MPRLLHASTPRTPGILRPNGFSSANSAVFSLRSLRLKAFCRYDPGIVAWLRVNLRRRTRHAAVLLGIAALMLAAACSKPPQASSAVTEPSKSSELASIPPANPSKYPPFADLRGWKNPYFVVREDGIGFVDLSNREVHILSPEEIPAQLVSLGADAWPYGRVVLVAEAKPKEATDKAKAEIRKNRGLLVGTLKDMDVAIEEAP